MVTRSGLKTDDLTMSILVGHVLRGYLVVSDNFDVALHALCEAYGDNGRGTSTPALWEAMEVADAAERQVSGLIDEAMTATLDRLGRDNTPGCMDRYFLFRLIEEKRKPESDARLVAHCWVVIDTLMMRREGLLRKLDAPGDYTASRRVLSRYCSSTETVLFAKAQEYLNDLVGEEEAWFRAYRLVYTVNAVALELHRLDGLPEG